MRCEWRQVGLIFSQSCSWLGLGFRIFCSSFHPVKAQEERHHLRKIVAFLPLSPGISKPQQALNRYHCLSPISLPKLSLTQKRAFPPSQPVRAAQDTAEVSIPRAAGPGAGAQEPQRGILPELVSSQVKSTFSLKETPLQLCCSFWNSPHWEGINSPHHLGLPKQTAGIIELIPHLLAD